MYHSADFVDTVASDRRRAAVESAAANRQLDIRSPFAGVTERFASWSAARLGRRTGPVDLATVAQLQTLDRRAVRDRRVASIPVPVERRVAERRMAAA